MGFPNILSCLWFQFYPEKREAKKKEVTALTWTRFSKQNSLFFFFLRVFPCSQSQSWLWTKLKNNQNATVGNTNFYNFRYNFWLSYSTKMLYLHKTWNAKDKALIPLTIMILKRKKKSVFKLQLVHFWL